MSATKTPPTGGVLASEMERDREQIVAMLTKAYWMEVETVVNYLACSINPDGVRAQEVVRSLAEDVQEELGHAKAVRRAHQAALESCAGAWRLRGNAGLSAAAG